MNDDITNGISVMKCIDIQDVLFDYMSRELGEARSDLVREHLRKCPECQKAAMEIQATMDFMKGSSTGDDLIPGRLSDEHRARIRRAVEHPVLDWIYVHHRITSLVITLIALVLIFMLVCRLTVWKSINVEDTVPVYIEDGQRILNESRKKQAEKKESGNQMEENRVEPEPEV